MPMPTTLTRRLALVAQAIATLALAGGKGEHIHENDAIRALAG